MNIYHKDILVYEGGSDLTIVTHSDSDSFMINPSFNHTTELHINMPRIEFNYKDMPKMKDSNMTPFNLEKALAGEKVVTRDGRKVNQLKDFMLLDGREIHGVCEDSVESWGTDGCYHEVLNDHPTDLFMAPKKLSGFVNIYRGDEGELFLGDVSSDKLMNKQLANMSNHKCVACIDLSTIEEGYGL